MFKKFSNRPTRTVELITRDGVAIDITQDQWPELYHGIRYTVNFVMIGIPSIIALYHAIQYITLRIAM